MKLDLLKILREDKMYKKGLEHVPEEERAEVTNAIESIVSELQEIFQSTIENNKEDTKNSSD